MAKGNKVEQKKEIEIEKTDIAKTDGVEIISFKRSPELKVTVLKPQIPALDLETNQETKVPLTHNKYTAPEYDFAIYGGNSEMFYATLMQLACELIQPRAAQIDALLYKATQNAYQAAKDAAFSAGNYLTPEVKSAIYNLLSGRAKFAEMSKADVLKYWQDKYREGDEGAIKVLAMARAQSEVPEF